MRAYILTAYLFIIMQIQCINISHQTTCGMMAENTKCKADWLHLTFSEQTSVKTEEDMLPFKKLGNSYYLFGIKQKVNWFKAAQICQSYNAGLVSIESAYEMEAISNYMVEISHQYKLFWTSGNDLDKEGLFIWWSTGHEFTYTKWAASEPNNLHDKEHCVQLYTKEPGQFEMNDDDCKREVYYICEKDLR